MFNTIQLLLSTNHWYSCCIHLNSDSLLGSNRGRHLQCASPHWTTPRFHVFWVTRVSLSQLTHTRYIRIPDKLKPLSVTIWDYLTWTSQLDTAVHLYYCANHQIAFHKYIYIRFFPYHRLLAVFHLCLLVVLFRKKVTSVKLKYHIGLDPRVFIIFKNCLKITRVHYETLQIKSTAGLKWFLFFKLSKVELFFFFKLQKMERSFVTIFQINTSIIIMKYSLLN